ncbi:cucumber peeling cupredoxin-like [Quillaja saponaria]|uniref:Cucumber peeling cupredoxin-like n=1 Tax=Quillaja saponaria TaxID=32244 RepID=A0AAD7LG30_QUISA|nr:cucumber peeling cupredoxin-like [Quillaja saponaria]
MSVAIRVSLVLLLVAAVLGLMVPQEAEAFGYAFGQHDFAEVTKDSNEVCNATEPIRLGTIGWINYSLDNPGDYYFICTFLYQCVRGQKLAIHVPPPPGSQSPLIATALPPVLNVVIDASPPGPQSTPIVAVLPPVLNVVIAASPPSPPPLPGTQAAPIERCFLLY